MGRRLKLIAIALVGVVGLLALVGSAEEDGGSGDAASSDGGGGNGGGNGGNSGAADEVDDVEITACEVDQFNFLTAELQVTNNSSEASDYFIDVTFESRNGNEQFGTGLATVTNLRPGQTRTLEAASIDEAPAGANFTCVVENVERTASL